MNTTLLHDDLAVIFNAEHSILLVNGALPSASTNPHFWQTCEPVNRAIHDQYGMTVTTLRCLHTRYMKGYERSVYLMEYQSGELPPRAEWASTAHLPALSNPVSAEDLCGWLDWLSSDHPLRKDWYRPAYFKNLIASLPARLPDATITTIEQVRSWERSFVARITTQDAPLYFKAVPPMFGCEPALAAWLYQQYPDSFPKVLESRPDQDFIMTAYEGKSLMEQPNLTLWQGELANYASLQVDLIAHGDELRALGVPERGLGWITAHTDTLLNDEAALKYGLNPLTDEDVNRLRALAPRLHTACAALGDYNIPLSLEHGDLWTGQIIARPDGNFLFTDWSDCAITHPFFSLPFFMAEVDNELPGEPDARRKLTDAYLNSWRAFESPARLIEAEAHARLLSPWYTTLRYYMDILPQMEIRWEMENMLTYNLRLLLRAAG